MFHEWNCVNAFDVDIIICQENKSILNSYSQFNTNIPTNTHTTIRHKLTNQYLLHKFEKPTLKSWHINLNS